VIGVQDLRYRWQPVGCALLLATSIAAQAGSAPGCSEVALASGGRECGSAPRNGEACLPRWHLGDVAAPCPNRRSIAAAGLVPGRVFPRTMMAAAASTSAAGAGSHPLLLMVVLVRQPLHQG